MTQYQANIYPASGPNPTVANADANRKNIGVCFSGGGSRALTCAWGQLIGLSSVKQPDGKSLLDDVRYISSVSGGSWAAVLYSFRPASISDDVFLGPAYPPNRLHYNSDVRGGLNVSVMGASSLGKVPQNFFNLFNFDNPIKNLFAEFIFIILLKGISFKEAVKWLWGYIVGKTVLADFKLYTYTTSLFKPHETPWNYADAKYFSLSKAYAQANVFPFNPAPSPDYFVYARTLHNGSLSVPMLIVNANVVGASRPGDKLDGPIQIPVQVSPVAGGIYGANPLVGEGIGGGAVESFAFTSQLSSLVDPGKVAGEFPRAYSLVDITACSSAFYAAKLAGNLQSALSGMQKMEDDRMHQLLGKFNIAGLSLGLGEIQARLSALQHELSLITVEDFVPQYNYWPVSSASQGASANQSTAFTDGGDLENTGVAGLIAQVQGDLHNIISFVNGSEALELKGGQIVAAPQMAPLFGICFDGTQKFAEYLPGGVNPFTGNIDPAGFLKIFANTHNQFDALRNGLYAANGSGASTNPAFFQQSLQLVDNTLLGIKASPDPINLLWVQNARVNAWQNQVTDASLKQKLQHGQQQGGIAPFAEFAEFANFPYYPTIQKIYQTAAETNTLAQMWAWCVGNPASPLNKALIDFFAAVE